MQKGLLGNKLWWLDSGPLRSAVTAPCSSYEPLKLYVNTESRCYSLEVSPLTTRPLLFRTQDLMQVGILVSSLQRPVQPESLPLLPDGRGGAT